MLGIDELTKDLAEIETLIQSKVIDEARGAVWKNRVIQQFESKQIPQADEGSDMPGLGLSIVRGFIRRCGDEYAGLSQDCGYIRMKTPKEAVDGLPEMYR